MLNRVLALSTAALFLAGTALAAPPTGHSKSKKAPKLTDVLVCPITGHPGGAGGGTEVVGKYKVHFCCPDCKPQFDKLSQKEKNQKITSALKKHKSGQKRG